MRRRKFFAAAGLSLLGADKLLGQVPVPTVLTSKKRSQIISTKVLVVGGGSAGIGAAIAASKTGAETLLIENYGFFGGVATWSIGMCLNQMRPNDEPRGFVHELLLQKLQNLGEQAVRINTHQFFVNVEYLKVAILDALDDVGCKYLVHVKAVDTITEGNRVVGVIVSTKSGLVEIKADVVVNCTGDADIAFFSGAPTLKAVSYTHLRAHETRHDLVCRLLLEKKKKKKNKDKKNNIYKNNKTNIKKKTKKQKKK